VQSSLAQIADRNRRVLGQLAPIGNAICVRRSRLEMLPIDNAIGEVQHHFLVGGTTRLVPFEFRLFVCVCLSHSLLI